MPIEGELKELAIPDFLQILSMNRKTGVITIEEKEKVINIYIKDGDIKFIFVEGSEEFYNLVLSSGILSGDMRKEIEPFKKDEVKLFKILIREKDKIGEDMIIKLIRPFLEDRMFELLQLEQGKFKFFEEKLDSFFDFSLKIHTQDLILESSRRIDEWEQIYRKLPSLEVVPYLSAQWIEKGANSLDLSHAEWKILSLVDGKKKVSLIINETGTSPMESAKTLSRLIEKGILAVREVQEFEEELKRKKAEEFFLKAREFAKKKQYTESEGMVVRALSLNPDFLMAHIFLGDLYYIQKQYRLSAQQYYEVIKRDPKNPLGYYNLGFVRVRFGDLLGALKIWEKGYEHASGKMKEELENTINVLRKLLIIIDAKRLLTDGR